MKAKIKINNQEIIIEDIKKVSWLGKYSGLMFRRNSPALVFDFGKPVRRGIHSLFCYPFIAVWIFEGKVCDYKIIDSWRFFIAPECDFDKLIEIPINLKYSHLISFFSDKN